MNHCKNKKKHKWIKDKFGYGMMRCSVCNKTIFFNESNKSQGAFGKRKIILPYKPKSVKQARHKGVFKC
jgi:hypothetical protein